MKSLKCPVCGEPLRRGRRKCKNCGRALVVCHECSSVYKKGIEICDMCGRELKKGALRRYMAEWKRDKKDDSAPCDLVSVINDIRTNNIGFKSIRALRIVAGIVAALIIIAFAVLGFFIGDAPSEYVVMIVGGCDFDTLFENFLNMIPNNLGEWSGFFSWVAGKSEAYAALSFLNYFVASLFLPSVVLALYVVCLHIPLAIVEGIVLGVIVKKKGYDAGDTVAVFERPTLIYNSERSFDMAYTYFPFIEKISGRVGSVVEELVSCVTVVLCFVLPLGIFAVHSFFRVLIWTVLPLFGMPVATLYFALTVILILTLIFNILILLVHLGVSHLVTVTVRRKQLEKWSKLQF